MKAVMYHYVRPDDDILPQYYYLDLDDFRAQLDYFESEYGFVDRESFVKACTSGGDLPDGVVLTFDDGLLDHYEWVFPELERRNLWGIFYVPTDPLVRGTVLDVHRIHALLGVYGGQQVLGELEPRVTEEMVPDEQIDEFREETYTRQDNAESTTLVKRILNYYVSYESRESLIDELVAAFPAAEVSVADLYMDEDHLRALQEAGMIVGSHSSSHRVFSKLSPDDQRTDISDSFAYLSDVLGGLSVKTFCYPYGGFHTFTDETRWILTDVGCQFSFNVESRDIEPEDVRDAPQGLPRYDCNEFENGGASGGVG
jgi:peptidoglycan/xylan/chitin deacetylase (PgdA/CDA1 family)